MVNTVSGGDDATAPDRSFRLHLDASLSAGAEIELPREAGHYVANVMRAQVGERFLVFNSEDGEWLAEIVAIAKRATRLALLRQTRPPSPPPDLWLLFAPIKKARTDFIVEKACEMGCRRVAPVLTERTQSERVRTDRLLAHAVEAAEQCGLVFVPEVAEPQSLAAALAGWDPARRLYFCDETRIARPLQEIVAPGPSAILIGPEGGFSEAEAEKLRGLPFVRSATLGPRVLRADTAAVAALALWQVGAGDWNSA